MGTGVVTQVVKTLFFVRTKFLVLYSFLTICCGRSSVSTFLCSTTVATKTNDVTTLTKGGTRGEVDHHSKCIVMALT